MKRWIQIAWVAILFAGTAVAQTDGVPFANSIRDVATTPQAAISRTTLTAAESGATLDFEVTLKMRNFAELQARVGRRELIGRPEMAARFHPRTSDYAAVVAWLKSQGLTITAEDASHVAVFGRGTIAQLSRAFQANFARVTFQGQEYTSAVTAPSLPAIISDAVLGINGLQPHLIPHKHIRKLAAPNPQSTTGNGPPFLPSQIATAYSGAGVTQTGTGQTIAIVIDTFPLNTDLTSFWTQAGVNQSLNNITEIQVVSGTLPAPSGEETLDTEWTSGMAPGAKIRIYGTVDLGFAHLDQAYAQVYSDLATQPTLHQMSMSFGLGEIYESTSQMQTDEQYFTELASAGVSIFVSSGDGGSDPTSAGKVGGTTPTPECPSNSPYVTAVGGTSLTVNSSSGLETSESVWNSSQGATGGGTSTVFGRPTWQTGSSLPSGTMRVVPDVAAPADPNTGALVVLNGSNQQYGGTSWSAPTWAGICALVNQARATGGLPSMGLLGPSIYPLLGGAAFRDITVGNNGAYSAGVGYDLCTGIGVPNIAALIQTLSGLPAITTQPVTQFVSAGQNVTFSITSVGTAPLTYQWQREPEGSSTWTNLTDTGAYTGSATASLTVSNVTNAMSGDQFQCIVTNSVGSATSASAQLVIGAPPVPLIVGTLAGVAGTSGSTNGTGSAAKFNAPGGIAFDNSGNIIVADTNNHTIRKVTTAGAVTSLAGLAGTSGSSNGTGTAARFDFPSNVTVDGSGNIFVADAGNEEIRKVTSAGVVTVWAGAAHAPGSTNATGSNARFNNPLGIAYDSHSGSLFVADSNNNLIRKITSTGVVTTFAGGGGGTSSGSVDGTGTAALFNFPVDVAADGAGNIYVADTNNNTIRKITAAGVVTTIAGTAGASGSTDGIGTSARFNAPSGVRADSAGDVYIADTNNQTIRKLTSAGQVTTIAGSVGVSGSTDGVGSGALFFAPSDALPDASGNVYVIDTNNDTLRKGVPATAPSIQTQPTNQTVALGQNATFTAAATGNPSPAYQWQRLPAGGFTWFNLTDGGAYTGSATATLTVSSTTAAMSGDQFECVATNAAGSAATSAVSLTVGVAPQITSAASATFTVGQAGNFTVTATGTPAPAFSATGLPSWASLNATTGVLTGTPTSTTGTPLTVNLTASNGFTPSSTQTFTLSVQSTFTSWQSQNFGANANTPGIAGPTAAPSGNGIPNLLEYAIGGNPLSVIPTVPLPATALATDSADGKLHLTLTATLDATTSGITISGQVSADLHTWNSGSNYIQIVSDTTVGTVRTLILRDATALGASPNHYIRLQITQP